jgi:hypothetical protein
MATCATQGQAAGTAAHLVVRHGLTPRQLGTTHTRLLQQTLLRQDAPLIGVRAQDEADLAPRARVTASSEAGALSTLPYLGAPPAPGTRPDPGAPPAPGTRPAPGAVPELLALDRDVAVLLPVDPRLDEVRLRTRAEVATTLTAEVWTTGKPQNYVPLHHERTVTGAVPAGDGETVLRLDWRPAEPGNVVLVLRATAGVAVPLTDGHPYGVQLMRAKVAGDAAFDEHIPDEADQAVTDWEVRPLRGRSLALTAEPASDAWRARRVVDGYQRPFGGPHLWSSEPGALDHGPVDLTLTWDEPVEVQEVRLVLNDDVDADLINLHHHRTHWDAVPDLVRDYVLEVREGSGWRAVVEVVGNRHRHRVHRLDAPVRTDALRLRVTATHGSPAVTVCAVKVY